MAALFDLTAKHVLITGASRGRHPTHYYSPTHIIILLLTTTITNNFSDLDGYRGGHDQRTDPGIGAACALGLAKAGASICLVVRPGSTNTATFDALNALPAPSAPGASPHSTVECDMGDLAQVKTLFARALDLMGGNIHILVNCAGIQRRAPAVEFSDEDWDAVRLSSLFRFPSFFELFVSFLFLFFSIIISMCRIGLSPLSCAMLECLLFLSVLVSRFSPSLLECDACPSRSIAHSLPWSLTPDFVFRARDYSFGIILP